MDGRHQGDAAHRRLSRLCRQRSPRSVVEVKVPFPFVVHGRTLPAGEYRVEYDPAESSVLVLRGEHGTRADTMTLTIPARKPDPVAGRPALAFKHDENGYRLLDVWESNDQGQEVPGS